MAQIAHVEAGGKHPGILLRLVQQAVDGLHRLLRRHALLPAQQHGQLQHDGLHGPAAAHEIRQLPGHDVPGFHRVDMGGFPVAAHDIHALPEFPGHVAVGILGHRDGHVFSHHLPQALHQRVLAGNLVQSRHAAGAVQLQIDPVDLPQMLLHPAQQLLGNRLKGLQAEHARGARMGVESADHPDPRRFKHFPDIQRVRAGVPVQHVDIIQLDHPGNVLVAFGVHAGHKYVHLFFLRFLLRSGAFPGPVSPCFPPRGQKGIPAGSPFPQGGIIYRTSAPG